MSIQERAVESEAEFSDCRPHFLPYCEQPLHRSNINTSLLMSCKIKIPCKNCCYSYSVSLLLSLPHPLQSQRVTRHSCPPLAPSILQFQNNPCIIVLLIYLPLTSFALTAADETFSLGPNLFHGYHDLHCNPLAS